MPFDKIKIQENLNNCGWHLAKTNMLSVSENWLNLLVIRRLSRLYVFPIDMDPLTGKVKPISTRSRRIALNFYLAVSFVYVVNSAFRYIHKLETVGIEALRLLPYYFFMISLPPVGSFMMIRLFKKMPRETVALLNNSMRERRGGKGQHNKPPPSKRKLFSLNYLELLTVGLPFVFYGGAVMIFLGVSLLDLFDQFEHAWLLYLKITGNGVVVFLWISWAYFSIHLQLLFMEKVSCSLKRETEALK